MPKRNRENGNGNERHKRLRLERLSHISALSDEVLLRIFAYLSVSTLNLCQRVSQRFYNLAGDSQIWKSLYYDRWVRPRVSRLPRNRGLNLAQNNLDLPNKLIRWLGEENLVRRGQDTNWKRQYKIRQRWSRGSCNVDELKVAEQPSTPPLLVRLHEGVIITADSFSGLRAWSVKSERQILASHALPSPARPTSLAVDISDQGRSQLSVAIGFDNGSYSIYRLDKPKKSFVLIHLHEQSSNGSVIAIALSIPYLLTMTTRQYLSFYEVERKAGPKVAPCARLLHALRSQTVKSPFSLSIRTTPKALIASVVYVLPLHISGWTIGIQELHLTSNGEYLGSRINAATGGFPSLLSASLPSSPSGTPLAPSNASHWRSRITVSAQTYGKPTSISYTHPYLLVSHADNTLTLYYVRSNGSELSISSGTRLWGHTSSVSSAHISGRGKAVSVSIKGEEIRVWELEGRGMDSDDRDHMKADTSSIQVRPEPVAEHLEDLKIVGNDDKSAAERKEKFLKRMEKIDISNAWIGFDEENVIIQKESPKGSQMLTIYNFT